MYVKEKSKIPQFSKSRRAPPSRDANETFQDKKNSDFGAANENILFSQ